MHYRMILAVFALLFATMASAQDNARHVVLEETTLATAGSPYTYTVHNQNHSTAYLIIKTANEVATATLIPQISGSSALGDYALGTGSAITTETTTVILLGSDKTAAGGVAEAFDLPLPKDFQIAIAVAGSGASFDVSIELQYVTTGY